MVFFGLRSFFIRTTLRGTALHHSNRLNHEWFTVAAGLTHSNLHVPQSTSHSPSRGLLFHAVEQLPLSYELHCDPATTYLQITHYSCSISNRARSVPSSYLFSDWWWCIRRGQQKNRKMAWHRLRRRRKIDALNDSLGRHATSCHATVAQDQMSVDGDAKFFSYPGSVFDSIVYRLNFKLTGWGYSIC